MGICTDAAGRGLRSAHSTPLSLAREGTSMAAAGATRELEQRLKSQNLLQLVEKHRCGESQDALLGRFLLARSSDVEKAFEFLKADLEWRESMNVRKYQGVTSSQLLAVNGTKTGSVAARSLAGKAMLDGMLPVMYLGYAELSCAFAVWCPVLIEGTRVSGETNRTVRSCTASLGAG
eukprot:3229552-Rhodomonas_salina.3